MGGSRLFFKIFRKTMTHTHSHALLVSLTLHTSLIYNGGYFQWVILYGYSRISVSSTLNRPLISDEMEPFGTIQNQSTSRSFTNLLTNF